MKSNFTKSNSLFLIALLIVVIISSFKNSSKAIFRIDNSSDNFLLDELYLKGKVKSIKVNCFGIINKIDTLEKSDYRWSYLSIFNEKGKTIKGYSYNTDGSLEFKDKYKYDKNENNTVLKRIYADGFLESKSIFVYDKNGNIIEKKIYADDGRIDSRYIMIYDNKGKLIEDYCYYDDSLEYKNSYKYYNDGNTIEKTSFHTNTDYKHFDLNCIYKYDNNGVLMGEFRYDFYGNLKLKFTYKYQFDSLGNWIYQIKYRNGEALCILEREFEYFE